MNAMRVYCGLIAGLMAVAAGGCLCPPPSSPRNAPDTAAAPAQSNRIDRAHTHISSWVESGAQKIDDLLTDAFTKDAPTNNADGSAIAPLPAPIVDPQGSGSQVVVSPGITYREDDGLKFRSRFGAHLNLPSLENRVQVIVNNVQEDEDVLRDVTDPFSRERRVAGEKDKSAGLRVLLVEDMRSDLAISGGVRFTPEPVPKLRLKGRLRYDLGYTHYELAETGFWQSDDGFGEKSEAIVAHAVTRRLSIRNTAAVLVEEETPGVTLGDTLALTYLLHERRTIGLTLGVEWITQPSAIVDSYAVRIPFRQGILRDWIYLRIEPGADFPNNEQYEMSPLITVGVEIQFGTRPPRRP